MLDEKNIIEDMEDNFDKLSVEERKEILDLLNDAL